jgi:hypothetical protein
MSFIGIKTTNELNFAKYAELEVRSLTGAHIAKAAEH